MYLIVTVDEYEFPLAVFDNLQEVSNYTGRTKNSINTSICRGNKDIELNVKYMRIDLNEKY